MERNISFKNIISSLLAICFLFSHTYSNGDNSANNQDKRNATFRLNHFEDNIENDEIDPYFDNLISGKEVNHIEHNPLANQIHLTDICSDYNEISSTFVDSLRLASFYLNYDSYTTLESKSTIDFSHYSRFEITDWLYNIGKINRIEKFNLYGCFFENAFFENERCLTSLYYNYKREARNLSLNNVSNVYSFLTRTNMQVYSTTNFDINYDADEFTTNYIPSQIGLRFEAIRAFFEEKGYGTPNNQSNYKYQINIFHNPGNDGEAGYTFFDGDYPTTTSYINMYYVSYTELDSKFNEVAAHEWYHALRANYYSGLDWFDESFATWAGIIYDGDSEFSNGSIIDFINADVPLDTESYNYGACLFPLVLYKDYGGHTFIKSFLTKYRIVSQNYTSYSSTEKFVTAINQTLISNGYSDTFDDALRNMHSYNYLPDSWYNDVCSTATTCYWQNSDKTTYNLLSLNGSAEYGVEGTKTYSNIIVSRLGRKYFQLSPLNGKSYNVEFEITFTNGNGYAQHHETEQTGAIFIGKLNNISNSTSWHFYGLGSRYSDAGIILTNASLVDDCYCTITIHYQTIRENCTFQLSDRLFQRRFYLDSNEYAEYLVQFTNPGRKIFQTLGQSDTVIELYTTSNSPLNNPNQDDDKGYSYNGFSIYDCSANETIKVKVRFYNSSSNGFIKLIITNSNNFANNQNGIQQFSDIIEIVHDNFYFGSWCTQYKTELLLYHPSTSGTVRVTLSSVFDNYLYIMDPTSNTLNQYGLDYDDDSGDGTNASITRYMSSSHPYLIVYSQYNPANSFANLDEGDDLTIHFERISN